MIPITFKAGDHTFFNATKRSVDDYFDSRDLKKTGSPGLFMKTTFYIASAFLVYYLLLFGHYAILIQILLCILLGFVLAFIAINVMHDANHGSFSESKRTNYIMGLTMNALGSNAFIWKIRHNLHHTFTNVDGIDYDIANWPLFRQAPTQSWKPIHRYQHLYMLPLYGFNTLEWLLVSDFVNYFTKRIANIAIQKISLQEHLIFWGSKAICLLGYILIPAWLLGWQNALIGFFIVQFTMSFILTVVFQLAHLVTNTSFESAGLEPKQLETDWAVHEVMTSSNFATNNKLLNWFAGGLNFQIEHHLFPNISHVHYPAISEIVRKECIRHDLPYHSYPTLSAAFTSHVQYMKKLGLPD